MAQGDGEAGRFDGYSEQVIGACIEVHRLLGPGLAESAYEECVAHELLLRGLRFERQRAVALQYKGIGLECGCRLDFVVEEALVVEIKSVDRLLPIHQAPLLTYMRLTKLPTSLLVNFRETVLKNGLQRLTLHPTSLTMLRSMHLARRRDALATSRGLHQDAAAGRLTLMRKPTTRVSLRSRRARRTR
jgi:GxxExxY protein